MDIPAKVVNSPNIVASSPAALFLSAFSSPSSSSLSIANSWNSLPPPDSQGQVINGYTLGAVIGYGSTSIIRLATASSGGVVACKIVKTQDTLTSKKSALRKEAAIWASLSHEHILPLFSSHFSPLPASGLSYAFFFTLYCPAGTLFDILQNAKRQRRQDDSAAGGLNQDDAGMLFRQVVRGLRYMHTVVGYVHRDIKLENILVDEQGHCRIADFGMARRIGSRSGHADNSSSEESDNFDDEEEELEGEDAGIVALTRTASLTIPSSSQMIQPPHHHILNRHLSLRRSSHSLHKSNTLPSRSRRRTTTDVSTDSSSQGKVQPGSLPYAAPELLMPPSLSLPSSQSHSKRLLDGVNPAQDIWALGVLLYVLLTGRFPFSDAFEPRLQMKILNGAYDIPPGIGRAAENVLHGCLSRSIRSRWTVDQVDEAGWGVGWGAEGDRVLEDVEDERMDVCWPNVTPTVEDDSCRGDVDKSRYRSTSADKHPFISLADTTDDFEEMKKPTVKSSEVSGDGTMPFERTRPCLSALHNSIFRGSSPSASNLNSSPPSTSSRPRNLCVDILSPTSYHGQEDSDSALLVSPLPTSTGMLSPLTEGVEQGSFTSSDINSKPLSAVHDAPCTPRRRIASPLPLSPLKGFVAPIPSPISSLSFAIPRSPSREGSASPFPATSSTSSDSELPLPQLLYKEDNRASPVPPSTPSSSSPPLVPLAGLGSPSIAVERGRPLRKHYALSRSPSPSVQPRTPLDTGFPGAFNEGQGNTTRRSSGSGSSGTRARSRAMESLENLQEQDASRGRSKYARLRPPGDVLSSFESGIEIMTRSDSGSSDAVVGLEHDRIRRPLVMDTVNELEGWAGARRTSMSDGKVDNGGLVEGTIAYDRLFSPERSVISPERSNGSLDIDPSSPLLSGRSASPRHHHGFGIFRVERDKGSRHGHGSDSATADKGGWASKGRDFDAGKNSDFNGIIRSRRAGSTPPTSAYFAKDSHIHSLHHLRPQHAHAHPATHHWTHSHTPVFLGSNHHPQKRDHFGLIAPMPLTPAGIHSGQHTPVAAMKSAPAHAVTVKVPVWGKGIGVSGMRSRSLGPL
ncbi:hypothetical protein EYR36_005485 [Pleurotus pulmonarius]|nr:hypothetical protein EYR36_005485 [Pleurotus pulmonarius]